MDSEVAVPTANKIEKNFRIFFLIVCFCAVFR